MKKLIFALILLCASSAWGADVKLDWDEVPGATGYKIQMSTDMGVTWLTPVDCGMTKPYIYTNVPEDRLIMFRVSAYNAVKNALNDYGGVWYDHRMKLANPTGVSVGN